ncbi:hypothetical protein [Litorisediminicola beolgyonensis]|uniref:Uncharacterized protein n=1 Tax=Litorisediminicola beolgyonensis TaxID=1173614 RepID=A0ABW3ZMN2_9RHOB
MSEASDRLNCALSLLGRLKAGAPERVRGNLDVFHPDTAELMLGYAFGDIVRREW